VGLAAQCTQFGFQTESNLFQTDSNLPENLIDKTSAFLAQKIPNKIWVERDRDKGQLYL
jgi:hypothetical protein